jgi:hypothetical protein
MKLFDDIKRKQADRNQKLLEELEDQVLDAELVRNFFRGELGQLIERNIEKDIQEVKAKFLTVDANDAKQVLSLQMEYKMLNRIKVYFAKALVTGNNALQALNIRNE